jgi:hypothetical protein
MELLMTLGESYDLEEEDDDDDASGARVLVSAVD